MRAPQSNAADGKECHHTQERDCIDAAKNQDVAAGENKQHPANKEKRKDDGVIGSEHAIAPKKQGGKVAVLCHAARKAHHTNVRREHRPTQDEKRVKTDLSNEFYSKFQHITVKIFIAV